MHKVCTFFQDLTAHNQQLVLFQDFMKTSSSQSQLIMLNKMIRQHGRRQLAREKANRTAQN